MTDDWSNARKPGIKANTTQIKNNTKVSTGNYKPSGNIVSKKVILSELINDGVCVNCLYGSCNNHKSIDERIPENLIKYIKNPNYIRNFGDELIKNNIDSISRYTTCKYMLSSCDNCNNGRCITMKYQSKDIILCYSKFNIGVHIDIIYEDKGKGFDLTVLPFNLSSIQIKLEDDEKSVSSTENKVKYANICKESINNNNIYEESSNNNISEDLSNKQELIDMKNKYSDMVSRYNKLNEDLISNKDLIKKNQELKLELNESKNDQNKLNKDVESLRNQNKLLSNQNKLLSNEIKLLSKKIENNKIHEELDNIIVEQIINTSSDQYVVFDA